MSDPKRKQLIQLISRIEQNLERTEQDLEHLKAVVNEIKPEKEWLSTAEFAEKARLELKTVSTYCGMGKFERIRKNGRGHWEIHKDELKNY
jgi:regulator of replication initiation timing